MSDLSPFATDESFPARSLAFSPRRRALFLDALANSGNARLACEAAAISPQTAYRARRADAGFARLWDSALLHARAAAEQVLADRALNGVDEPIFYRGEEIGHRRRYDSRLLLAHLARLDRLAERAEAGEGVRDFDGALAVLESGGEWQPDDAEEDAPADQDENVPELEAAMRLLEAQGWAEIDGEWQYVADARSDPPRGDEGDQPQDGGGEGEAPDPAPLSPDNPDPNDFRRWLVNAAEGEAAGKADRKGAKRKQRGARACPSTTFGGPQHRGGEESAGACE